MISRRQTRVYPIEDNDSGEEDKSPKVKEEEEVEKETRVGKRLNDST